MINILLLSDIHLLPNRPLENQGQVITAFVQDLTKTLDFSCFTDNFCIIAGDLAQDGLTKSYEFFYKTIITPLLRYMPLENIYVVAGNHDLNRNTLEYKIDDHKKYIADSTGESKFNDALTEDKKCPLKAKFNSFVEFCNSSLNIANFNLWGYYVNPVPSLSVCLINSSICSFGGLNDIEDSTHLRVNTRIINDWIQNNPERKKILVMHHPLADLEYNYNNELTKLIESNVDIFINGHTHFDKVSSIESNGRHYIHLQSPQLFSSKDDMSGYAVLKFDKDQGDLQEIIFRQWIDRRKCFSTGVFYSDDGKFSNENYFINIQDELENKLEERLNSSMKSFSMTPKWQERYLDENAPIKQTAKSGDWDYVKILSSEKNFQICAPAQFGLTCYAQYLSLKAWQLRKEHWLYADVENIRAVQIDNVIETAQKFHMIKYDEVSCIVLDNWPYTSGETGRMLGRIKKHYPNSRILFFVKSIEADIVSGLDSEFGDSFMLLYLRPISRKNMRCMVTEVNAAKNFAEDNSILLNRLAGDIKDLNMHRTPYNCLQLLMAFSKNYEERPINRTRVLDNILGMVFDTPGALSYQSDLPDAVTCKYIVGSFCEWLFRKEPFIETFTEDDFCNECKKFCDQECNSTNPHNIFRAFLNNQIIITDHSGRVRFRHFYWLCYFLGDRMKRNSDFRTYMIEHHHAIYNQEMVDFYSATDREREDIVDLLAMELSDLTKKVHVAIGFPETPDPYSNFKWAMNEVRQGLTAERLKEQVTASNLPEEIKDAVADKDYNSVKPYFQTINKFLDDYYVRNLMSLIRSASIAFRNSEFVTSGKRRVLSESIFAAWIELARVLYSITHVLAKNGFSGIGGARFTLEGNFSKEFEECVKQIYICIPSNIVNWFGGDLFSNKNAPIYYGHLSSERLPLERHFAAVFIAQNRPSGFKDELTKYIKSLHKNSFYLGDLATSLQYQYTTQFMSVSDQHKTLDLLAECYNNTKKYLMPAVERDNKNIE